MVFIVRNDEVIPISLSVVLTSKLKNFIRIVSIMILLLVALKLVTGKMAVKSFKRVVQFLNMTWLLMCLPSMMSVMTGRVITPMRNAGFMCTMSGPLDTRR